ncbi:MAG: hypothetical protein GX677_06065 [Treponema sp.]|jgi:hypothetical protein|nr:hypothetical protein [Treponema sp.]
MIQFYFLSILFNLFVGLILIYGKKQPQNLSTYSDAEEEQNQNNGDEKSSFKDKVNKFGKTINENQFVSNRTFKLVLGILAALTGIMKLLSVVRTDVPVVGDLLPSLAGLFGGASLILDYVSSQESSTLKFPTFIQKYFIEDTKILGYFCVIVAIVHFIFPDVLFL